MDKCAVKNNVSKSDSNSSRLTSSSDESLYSTRTMPSRGKYSENRLDIICLSHLRWDFVYQRPQHLLSRCAREQRVFFVEEPIFGASNPYLDLSRRDKNLWVVVPQLPHGLTEAEVIALQQSLLIDHLFLENTITDYILWYYTPMAMPFTRHLEPVAIIYDCMDELSSFKNAPYALKQYEAELFERADLVLTGGFSLYEAKQHLHPNVHPFPSSIDVSHFGKARRVIETSWDQVAIPRPRLGFCGVIDERMNLDLLAGVADARPEWQLVLVGPVVKIDPEELPYRENIHYLGGKSYQELPAYLSGWDIAMLPFAHNESTKYISPTKTPEYLAAGLPTVSTSIQDVVRPWGRQKLVQIADTTDEFIGAIEYLMGPTFNYSKWLRRVDEALSFNSWDRTWARVMNLLNATVSDRYPDLVTTKFSSLVAGQTDVTSVSPLTNS